MIDYKDVIKDRIKAVRTELGIQQGDFADSLGLKQGSYSDIERGKNTLSSSVLYILAKSYNVNINWLYTGDGNMFIKTAAKTVSKTVSKAVSNTEKEDILAVQSDREGIPLIPIEAMAGFGTAESVQVFENQLTERYVIPEFKGKVDFFIRVYGTSMYPKYNSGDIVACKRIESLSFVQWNKTYVLDTTQGALVKRLIKSSVSGNIVCRSDNKDYPDFELEINSDIHAIALIIGVIRFE